MFATHDLLVWPLFERATIISDTALLAENDNSGQLTEYNKYRMEILGHTIYSITGKL